MQDREIKEAIKENNRLIRIMVGKDFSVIPNLVKVFGLLSALGLLMIFGWMMELVQDYPEIHSVSITVTIGVVIGFVTFILYIVDMVITGIRRQKELGL